MTIPFNEMDMFIPDENQGNTGTGTTGTAGSDTTSGIGDFGGSTVTNTQCPPGSSYQLLGYEPTPMGGDPYGSPIYGCREDTILVPTPTPTPSETSSTTPSVTPSATPSVTPSATPSATPPQDLCTNRISPPVFQGCDGTTGILFDGCRQIAAPGYTYCLPTQTPTQTPTPTPSVDEGCSTSFISCDGNSAWFYSGAKNASGQCAVTLVPNYTGCISPTPTPSDQCPTGFIDCVGTTARYYNGQRDSSGQCAVTEVPNDNLYCPSEPPPPPDLAQCGGSNFGICPPGYLCVNEFGNDLPEYRCVLPNEPPLLPTPTIVTPTPTIVTPTPTPTLPTPTPTPTPTWRSCVDGELNTGVAPSNYKLALYLGAGGGLCWEPKYTIGFEPSLQTALNFLYRRGTSQYPSPVTIKVTNPSYASSYQITFNTNPDIIITPKTFTLTPRSTESVIINVTPTLYDKLGDGISNIGMNVDIVEI